ncbi:AraC family transcriptional regulator [Paenibacillaceae bacterium]|nr:AraC family transcriptional regulator [Paenibacillaceae bacterium]
MDTVETVQRAIDYIEERLDEPQALEQIAEAAVMSLPNLYRLFYSMTGHPIKEYIRKRRVSEAACFLRETNLPTIDIGIRWGFETYQTFIKTFKRSTGLTPGQYRKSDTIFSFERICLNEQVTYFEEREVSERFPDVKVIRFAPQKGIGYLYTAKQEVGLEDTALANFRSLLEKSELDVNQLRMFGWNVDLDGKRESYGYQMVAVSEKDRTCLSDPELIPVELPGGLYAVTRTPAGSGRTIVATWDRLLSDWLPRSTFELGEQSFLEEYQQFNGQIARLKLYLPVKRRQDTETIQIVERSKVKVISFRESGNDCVIHADEASVKWLTSNGFVGDTRLQVFMSCSFPQSEMNTYEVYIAPPEGFVPTREDKHRMTWIESGLYACMTTRAYGSMTGILERIYRWLGVSHDYEPDGERSWYAQYVPYEGSSSVSDVRRNIERSVSVVCFVPIILQR